MSNSNPVRQYISLIFPLEMDDDWPPVATESLPFEITKSGYIATAQPLFVKNLSVGDLINATVEPESSRVLSWEHVAKSARTTVWILRLRSSHTIEPVLAELRALGCNTTGLDEVGIYAIDVPEWIPIEAVDFALTHLDNAAAAAAFPSLRHHE